MKLDARIPEGPLPQKWNKHGQHQAGQSLPTNGRYEIIVVGTGLSRGFGSGLTRGAWVQRQVGFAFEQFPARS